MKRKRQCMCAACDLRPDQRIFCLKDMSVDLFKLIPSHIIVTVTVRRGKTCRIDTCLLHRIDDFKLSTLCSLIDLAETWDQVFQDLLSILDDIICQTESLINFMTDHFTDTFNRLNEARYRKENREALRKLHL